MTAQKTTINQTAYSYSQQEKLEHEQNNSLKLFDSNKHLVVSTIYKMLGQPVSVALSKRLEFDDLVQAGNLGLWRACTSYKEGLSSFQTYAINHIRWAIQDALNFNGLIKYNIHKSKETYDIVDIHQDVSSNDEHDLTYADIIANDRDFDEEFDEYYIMKKLLESCSEREKEILIHKYNGYTNKEIANKLQVAPSLITYYLHSIRKKFDCITDSEFEE